MNEPDICSPVALKVDTSFLDQCQHVEGDCPTKQWPRNGLDYLEGEAVSRHYHQKLKSFLKETSGNLIDFGALVNITLKQDSGTETHNRAKRLFDPISFALATAATVVSASALAFASVNRADIEKLFAMAEELRQAVNAHDKTVLQHRNDIITVQTDVANNSAKLETIYSAVTNNTHELSAFKYATKIENAMAEYYSTYKMAISRAALYGEMNPMLVPEKYLFHALKEAKGSHLANLTIYQKFPMAFYTLGRIELVKIFSEASLILALTCVPLIYQTDVQVLYRAQAIGIMTDDSNVIAIPRIPSYVAYPFMANSFSLGKYVDKTKCKADKSFLVLCPKPDNHRDFNKPECEIDPSKNQTCKYDLFKLPDPNVQEYTSAVRVGSNFFILTNLDKYQLVGRNKEGGIPIHNPHQAVKNKLDVYSIPLGSYLEFGNDVIYGVRN